MVRTVRHEYDLLFPRCKVEHFTFCTLKTLFFDTLTRKSTFSRKRCEDVLKVANLTGTSQSPEMTSPTVTKPAHQKTTTTSSMWNVSTNAATHITDIYNYSTNNASALPFVETTTSRVDPTTSQVDSGNGGQGTSDESVTGFSLKLIQGCKVFP